MVRAARSLHLIHVNGRRLEFVSVSNMTSDRIPAEATRHRLRAVRVGIDTYQEPVVYMHADCDVCRSEGFAALARIRITLDGREVVATLNVVHSSLVDRHEAGLSNAAWDALGAHPGKMVEVSHPDPLESFSKVRGKIYGRTLDGGDLDEIIADVVAGRYSGLELASFVTACAGDNLSLEETIGLTRAMVSAGAQLSWPAHPIVDKHCIGGLPGNRTTPIVVAIVAAAGLVMPKTSSRAITSPAGTADTMEVLAPVALSLPEMRRVVEREGGCVVWGAGMGISPADDILIHVERPLDFDSDGQLTASVLSKKIAAGASHALIDIPVGPTAKVRGAAAATSLSQRMTAVAGALGLSVKVVQTDGTQPVGRGIGPALEARDLMAVLRQEANAPRDLSERAVSLAGQIIELGGRAPSGHGSAQARALLSNGAALQKFEAICEAQGGMRSLPTAAHRQVFAASSRGRIMGLDNRKLARIAKLAGAPRAAAAGLDLHVRLGDSVEKGQPLFTLHAESPGELAYAMQYGATHGGAIAISD
jgi:thymidine phosphorylase